MNPINNLNKKPTKQPLVVNLHDEVSKEEHKPTMAQQTPKILSG